MSARAACKAAGRLSRETSRGLLSLNGIARWPQAASPPGYVLDLGFFQVIGPTLALDGLYLREGQYKENNAGGVGVALDSQNQKSVRGFAGIIGQGTYNYDSGRPDAAVRGGLFARIHERSVDHRRLLRPAPGSPFHLVGPTLEPSHLVGGMSLGYVLHNWSAGVNYDASANSGSLAQSATISISSRSCRNEPFVRACLHLSQIGEGWQDSGTVGPRCSEARLIRSRILALALVVAGIAAASPVAAVAQDTPARADARVTSPVSLTYLMDRLSLFGRWFRNPKWGVVWQPDAGPTFRPYFFGYWQDTEEYGWFWVSSEPYGDIVYHYGRWVFDQQAGWLWVPGYVWGPSWVVWRESENAIGWMPMPPGYADYESGGGLPRAASGAMARTVMEGLYGRAFAASTFYDLWAFVAPEDFGLSRRRRGMSSIMTR